MSREAQSEAPSVDDILAEFMNKACDYEAGLKVDLDKSFEEAEAKINRLIIEAELRGFDKAFDSHDYDGLREYRVELSNNLSKEEDNG